ncbi:hypothetical protein N7462_002349 [Penicillium macrosclerotiorum]|uniref:uncharacterized protein n=1 Tax=Penicillium macrosclerotiorum TaxID=303699 RepID=UPI002547FE61|nr:uncharacterized protein N7462_002349 [Penicillium macrosclerotiorum]KAJ5692926.1 hypothetical protein N7462_002349 [Penicillium macrosclerotiorum]
MRIIDPQSAVLTNVEVLAYLSSNPPAGHRAGRQIHGTGYQIHNYASRISPHLLKYPRFTSRPSSSQSQTQAAMTGTMRPTTTTNTTEPDASTIPPPPPSNEITPMDKALRDIVSRLQPYGLTKAELVTILNLGIGLSAGGESEERADEEMTNGHGDMEVDGEVPAVNGDAEAGEAEPEGEEGMDYGAMALFDSVIEEREYRISDEQLVEILAIIRETLVEDYGS